MRRLGCALAFVGCLLTGSAPVDAQSADVNAEARVFFEQGNRHLERAGTLRGRRQREAYEEALQAYVQSLRIVRSRNALWNAAGVLEALQRHEEAFAYYREYRDIPGLSESDVQVAAEKLVALRERVAVVSIVSEPSGAEVFVDRLDLAARGRTPLELALPEGPHRFFLRLAHHQDAEVRGSATIGQRVELRAALVANPVAIVLESGAGRLTLNGEPVDAGRRELAPGDYVVVLERAEGPPIERRFTVAPGQEEARIVMMPDVPEPGGGARLSIVSTVVATISVDGVVAVRQSRTVELPVSSGPHVVRVEPIDGRPAFEETVTVGDGQTANFRVDLGGEPTRRFGVLPGVLLVTTAVLATATIGLIAGARIVRNDREDACVGASPFDREQVCDDGEADVNRMNLAADSMLGVTAAAGITALVLLALNKKQYDDEPPSSQIQLSLSPSSVFVVAEERF